MPQLAACLEGLQWDPLCHNKLARRGRPLHWQLLLGESWLFGVSVLSKATCLSLNCRAKAVCSEHVFGVILNLGQGSCL